ncbi:MAG: hypothetical protein K2N27_03570 [Ruminococcus sp.]|nr:hypothetical protein [Ruminococcus sp.]MDE7363957.1 hypothetical protein [Ruminococcus sp.]
MNACVENTVQITKNISIPVTYNVNMGVGRMKNNQIKETAIEASNQAEFKTLIKIGVYKSLYSEGVISYSQLMALMEKQKRGSMKCH